jgi:hypothetical protein
MGRFSKALNSLQYSGQPLTGVWYRAVQTKFLGTALASRHTTLMPSRFGSGRLGSGGAGPQLLYLGQDHQVALLEVGALLGSPSIAGGFVAHPATTWTVLNVTVQLQSVLDLTDVTVQTALGTSAQELTGDWFGYQLRALAWASVSAPLGLAPTQELGEDLVQAASYHGPWEGFLTLSSRAPDRRNLVVFPNQLEAGSSIKWMDPLTNIEVKIEHGSIAP